MGASRRSPRRIITPQGSDITDRDETGRRRRRRRRMAGERPFDFRRRDITRRRPEPREKRGLFVPDPEAKRERLKRRRERLMEERKQKLAKRDPDRERKRRAITPREGGRRGTYTMNFAPGTPIEVKEAAYEKFAPKGQPSIGPVRRRENPNPRPRI